MLVAVNYEINGGGLRKWGEQFKEERGIDEYGFWGGLG